MREKQNKNADMRRRPGRICPPVASRSRHRRSRRGERGRTGRVQRLPAGRRGSDDGRQVDQRVRQGLAGIHTRVPEAGQNVHRAARAASGGLRLYYSIDPSELRDRKVVHWIDNTGALAAMVKGYARQTDGARIVHAFSALVVRLGFSTWFEYVRTKANLAHLPSREGLQGYEQFEDYSSVRSWQPILMMND